MSASISIQCLLNQLNALTYDMSSLFRQLSTIYTVGPNQHGFAEYVTMEEVRYTIRYTLEKNTIAFEVTNVIGLIKLSTDLVSSSNHSLPLLTYTLYTTCVCISYTRSGPRLTATVSNASPELFVSRRSHTPDTQWHALQCYQWNING
jgi:hypothetical protein